jgi:RiboL-PSP-HEPN
MMAPRGSQRYILLTRRIDELHANLLYFLPPYPRSRTSYTTQEFDLTRAYVMLAHAEIESFCEDLVTKAIGAAKQHFDSRGTVSPTLRRIVAYFVGKNRKSWDEYLKPTQSAVDAASTSHSDTVKNNHGIKRENLEKLFYPLGVLETDLNTTWLAQMDSFGSNRGYFAHKSVRAANPPDPRSQATTVHQLLNGLLTLDRKVSKL